MSARTRRRLLVTGAVQGVGFRPFVHARACALGLGGFVRNGPEGVVVEAEGERAAVEALAAALLAEAPPLAVVEDVVARELAPQGTTGFRIEASADGPALTRVPPDAATCPACLAELRDAGDRRHGHAFISCPDCGPRFTIARDLPFDRERTTMAAFPLCPACRTEYEDPADRRFHAQTIACPQCGPRLWLAAADGDPGAAGDASALAAARDLLDGGGILAVKGLGGWHLACDARDPDAVARLRARKGRGDKPFAVMAADIAHARELARLGEPEAAELASPRAPIVLAPARPGTGLAPAVAPGTRLVGLLRAYTPVHQLLVRGDGEPAPRALVMTSGNRADEPIARDDEEARERLAGIADARLGHDRAIAARCEDSVVRAHGGRTLPVRRSRGWVPMPVPVPAGGMPALALGGDLKCAPALAADGRAVLGPHLGDLDGQGALGALEEAVEHLGRVAGLRARAAACDPHPGYRSSRWARTRFAQPLAVQHHHAHVAAVMAEHGLGAGERVIGVAFDGTGYGVPGGTIWGGELLIAGYDGFRRAGHLAPVPLPGGDAAIRRPARIALAHLHAAGVPWDPRLPPVAAADERERRVLARMLETGAGCVPTTSVGRLFDAVAALAGVRQETTYEGQPAIELESAADRVAREEEPYPLPSAERGETLVLDPAPLVRAAAADVLAGAGPARVAARFHEALARATAGACGALARRTGLTTVALGGGVFANVLLLDRLSGLLARPGLTVLAPRLAPPNDGGLALGQAAVAAVTLRS